MITRAYRGVVDSVDRRRRAITSRINTAAKDRFKTCIIPSGGDTRNYQRAGGAVLWEHGLDATRGSLPVGRNEKLWPAIGPEGLEFLAETSFYEKGKKGDDFTEQLYQMYADGDLRSFSIRILPTGNCSPPTRSEIRERPELADCEMMYRSWEMLEYSCVAVPGNADCLSTEDARSVLVMQSRGLLLPSHPLVSLARLAASSSAGGLPPLGGRSLAAYQAEKLSQVRALCEILRSFGRPSGR